MWGDRMPIKGMFNQKAQKKDLDDWGKQILRINSLEVQMKGLLDFEKKIRTSMYSNSSGEKKEQERVKTQDKDFQVKNRENAQKFHEINKGLEELGQRVYQLENFIEEKGLLHSNPLPREEENIVDERLIHLIEQLVLEEYAVHSQSEKQLVEKIQALENQISILEERIKVPDVDQSFIEEKELLHSNPLPREEENIVDEGLIPLIEQLVLEKYAVHSQREKQLVEKIQALENQISILEERIQVPDVDQSFIEEKELLHSNPLPREEENIVDEGLIHLIEQLVLEKYAVHSQREKQLVEKIQALENQISIL